MCGIFGSINVNDWDSLEFIIDHARRRGRDSSGIVAYTKAGRYDCVRADYDIKRLKRSELELIKSSTAVFGHSRLITDGFLDNQPVIRDNIFVIHNGIITNSESIWRDHPNLIRRLTIDSEIINALTAEYLKKNKDLEGLADYIFDQAEGAISALIGIPELGKIALISNNGSLFYSLKDEGYLISSEKYPLVKMGCRDINQIDKEIKTSEMKLDTINKTMVTIREKELLINRYETSIEEIKKQTTKLGQEIANLTDEKVSTAEQTGELNQLQEQLTDTDIKKKKDKEHKVYIDTARALMQDTGIKTKIIKQYLPIMNQYINKYLADMDFFVNFTLDEEFNETIRSRYRDEFNYHSFSEGEKLRIDLSILFTWREIAKLKNSTNTNLLILDEIFDSSLDSSGTDEFMRILHTTTNKENVFVISHKGDTLIDKFPRVMKFEKYKNFTRMAE